MNKTRNMSSRVTASHAAVFACAAAAGAHAGLVPEHLRSEPRLGVAFVLAVLALLAGAIAFAVRPDDKRIARAAALLFASLIAAYAASRTTGIPLLSPDPEAIDAVGLATNLVEALGLGCAWFLVQTGHRARRPQTLQEVSL